MKKQGFTLVELIVVIVILGILAVSAAPKFIDLQNDARGSTLKSLLGSLKSSVAMFHAKAVIQNKNLSGKYKTNTKNCDNYYNPDDTTCIDIGSVKVRYQYDYPDVAELYKLVDGDILAYDAYSDSGRCAKHVKTICEHDLCNCFGIQLDSDVVKELSKKAGKTLDRDNDLQWNVTLFWPRGTALETNPSTNGCFMLYVQPTGVATSNAKIKEPIYYMTTKGC